jgi:ribosomal protein S18 acetylase RimI-like enzyme
VTPEDAITFRHHDAAGARTVADDVIVPLYEATHPDVLDTAFSTTERFLERLRGYTERDGFELVVAHSKAGRAVGLAFGYPLPPTSRWWDGLVTEVPAGFTPEDGQRTFALNEIMVHPERQRQGIARALHDELLSGRPERRATLLVRSDNDAAHSAYARWGWRTVAKLKPFPDSPVFDALILPLTADE